MDVTISAMSALCVWRVLRLSLPWTILTLLYMACNLYGLFPLPTPPHRASILWFLVIWIITLRALVILVRLRRAQLV